MIRGKTDFNAPFRFLKKKKQQIVKCSAAELYIHIGNQCYHNNLIRMKRENNKLKQKKYESHSKQSSKSGTSERLDNIPWTLNNTGKLLHMTVLSNSNLLCIRSKIKNNEYLKDSDSVIKFQGFYSYLYMFILVP